MPVKDIYQALRRDPNILSIADQSRRQEHSVFAPVTHSSEAYVLMDIDDHYGICPSTQSCTSGFSIHVPNQMDIMTALASFEPASQESVLRDAVRVILPSAMQHSTLQTSVAYIGFGHVDISVYVGLGCT